METEKFFVLDTNVLIHNPKSIYSFTDSNVVVPLVVIEELDSFKSYSDERGYHARTALKALDLLARKGAVTKGAKLKNGGHLFIHLGAEKPAKVNLDPKKNDNKIIFIALEYQKNNESLVFFISKDVNARIKAEALGLKARDYEKQKADYSKLYQGWRYLELTYTEINKLYEKSFHEVKGQTFMPNEYSLIRAKDHQKPSAICKFDEKLGGLKPLVSNYESMGIQPLNFAQKFAFDLLLNSQIDLVTLIGQAGTGKTLIAIACALTQVMDKKTHYEKLLIARPIIPMGKDIGYLPGEKDQKLRYWMRPIFDNLDFILKSSDPPEFKRSNGISSAVDYLINSDLIEIEALTYIRGRSIPNQFLIVDEAQNLTPHEIKTIISRAGKGTKIVLTGDPDQIDNPYLDANSNGLTYAVEKLKGSSIYGHVFLNHCERSDLAKLVVDRL